LSNEELGEHYFMSTGVHNRQCDKCKQAAAQRKLNVTKHSDGMKVFGQSHNSAVFD
jgi:hypothetical protein